MYNSGVHNWACISCILVNYGIHGRHFLFAFGFNMSYEYRSKCVSHTIYELDIFSCCCEASILFCVVANSVDALFWAAFCLSLFCLEWPTPLRRSFAIAFRSKSICALLFLSPNENLCDIESVWIQLLSNYKQEITELWHQLIWNNGFLLYFLLCFRRRCCVCDGCYSVLRLFHLPYYIEHTSWN